MPSLRSLLDRMRFVCSPERVVRRRLPAESWFGQRSHRRVCPTFESLEPRQMLAVSASFSAATGVLSVYGDSADNILEISRSAAGAILINVGAVAVSGGVPSVANTTRVQVFGMSGNDTLTLNEANGALPPANLYGGAGNDTIVGGSSADRLFGQSGNDSLSSRGGGDLLFGGSNADVLTGGDGDDQAFGQSENDRLIWNPGDDTDLNEGGSGADTVEVNGGNGAEMFTATANGARVRFDRVDPAPFFLDIGGSEDLVVNANAGNDAFSATGNLAALIRITVDGGLGDDTLNGSNGADVLIGGDNNDVIDGNQGSDTALMGAGDDVFVWDPGDGSDVVEGQNGTDTLLFNGSAIGEIFDFAANGNRVRMTRNIGNVVMDLDDVEKFQLNAIGGSDTVVVNDLAGTDATQFDVNLGAGDAVADNVIVHGTAGDDVIVVSGSANAAALAGLAALVNIAAAEPTLDRLTVLALAGDDVVEAASLPATAIQLTADGGADDDVLTGGEGPDTLLGDAGDDVLIGGPGLDILDGGTGENILIQG